MHTHLLLTEAAVCGAIFASPNPSQVRRGIDLVESDKGYVRLIPRFLYLIERRMLGTQNRHYCQVSESPCLSRVADSLYLQELHW